MPSFLSKVFGRKKDDALKTDPPQKRPSSDASLLEGKFEAVPKVLSPTSPRFDVPPHVPTNGKESDGLGLFKSKSIRNPSVAHGRELDYHLSLNLPGPKEESSRALGVVFEADPDAQLLLPESVIAERRLSPLEVFLLVQACSQVITSRGLETLGIMIPHWYSASPSAQRKLISLFVQSLALNSPITTLSPTASSPVSAFESEINTTRSPHDVAAVLRWGLRHLQLDGASFGKDDQWYTQFLNSEKSSEYPPKAFTEKLAPLLPPAHLHLLTATLEIFSSLAAHAEANSISGSKLSKMLGLWILAAPRVAEGDDVLTFYAQWEKWGRILEHLFLARIRDEAADHRMPTRLVELVKHYPYAKTASPDADPAFLPSPRFSTRRYDALYVGIETEIPSTESKKHKNHPLRLIADALKASTKSRPSTPDAGANGHTSSEIELWESLKKHVSVADADSESYPGLSSLFADETIRFLSLIPTTDLETKATEPAPFTLFIPEKVGRRRSMSLGDRDAAVAAANNAHSKAASSSTSDAHGTSATSSEEPLAIDWSQFSTSGFFSENGSIGSKLASTLLDNKDVEVTIPRKPSSKRKLPPALIPLPSSRGKSLDLSPIKDKEPGKEIKQGRSRATRFETVQLDEAFIDFWSDALLDPISADWPGFVVCKIKSSVPAVIGADNKRVGWLIIEQRFVTPKPATPAVVTTPEKEHAARPRPNSPKPSFASDSKSTKKNRFSFFTSISSSSVSTTSTAKTDRTKDKKKAGKGPKVGEMGEILKEEEEPSASTSVKSNGVSSTEVAAVATAGVAAGLAAAVATALPETPKQEEAAPATLVEDAANTQVAPTPAADESKPPAAADVTPSLVEDVAKAQVAEPTEPASRTVAEAEPAPVAAEQESVAPPPVKVEPAAPVIDAPPVPEDIPNAEPAPVVKPEPAAETQPDAEEAARLEAERVAEAQRLQAEAERERIAAEEAVVAQQKAAEERARLEAERLAEQERIAAEEAAKAKAEVERLAAEEAERARLEAERLAEEERARLEEERLAEERRVQAEKERIAAEEAAQALLAQQKAEEERIAAEEAERARLEAERLAEEERMRLEEQRLAEERRVQAEKERIAAEEAAAALLAKQKAEEEERARLEAERIAAEEAERARIAAEEAERARIAAEEAERVRLEEEARLAKEKAEEEERTRLEAERIAAEEAALAKQKAEEEERARLEAERIAAEEAERERLAAEEAERARLERERLEEEERLAKEKAEEEERARLEAERIAAEEAERERLAAEEAERVRLEEERLAEERRAQEEKERIAAEEAALAKQKAEEEERARLEAERIAAEEAALAKQKAEEEAARLEAERLAAEEAERARLAAEEAERARIAAEEAERARLEEEARLKAEEEERARVEAERIAAEEAALAKAKAEEEERARLEAERIAAEEAEQQRLAAEEAERARLECERLEEEERLAKEKAEEEERARLEAERIAAEEAERERLAAEEAERVRLEEERLAEERRAQEEKERLAAEEAALAKQKAEEEERARVVAEEAERERVAAEEAERERQAAQQAEQERLEKERLEAEAAASPPAEPEPKVMIVNDEPVAVADEEPAPRAATPVEVAESVPIAPEAQSSDGGLQFDTSAEVIGAGHIEPLREPEAANDALVDLPAVPVVEARPDLVRGTTAISHLELTPSPDDHGEAAREAVDGMLPGGETVGPQAALSIAEESATELKHAEETNGNGTNGHSPEDAETPAE